MRNYPWAHACRRGSFSNAPLSGLLHGEQDLFQGLGGPAAFLLAYPRLQCDDEMLQLGRGQPDVQANRQMRDKLRLQPLDSCQGADRCQLAARKIEVVPGENIAEKVGLQIMVDDRCEVEHPALDRMADQAGLDAAAGVGRRKSAGSGAASRPAWSRIPRSTARPAPGATRVSNAPYRCWKRTRRLPRYSADARSANRLPKPQKKPNRYGFRNKQPILRILKKNGWNNGSKAIYLHG